MTAQSDAPYVGSAAMAEAWFVRLRSDDPGAQARLDFDQWIGASADNRRAWYDLHIIWGDLDMLRGDEALLNVRQQALERQSAGIDWPAIRRIAAIAIPVLLLAGTALFWADGRQDRISLPVLAATGPASYFANPVGRRSRILLADGSIVQLDADSALTVDFSDRLRSVTLERGRALFHVAKNRQRPFVVTAAGRGVTALGTRFSVDIQQQGVRVVLDEGRVRVDDRRRAEMPGGHRVDLSAGHMLLAGDQPTWRPVVASTSQLLAWTNGQLLFDDQRLADVVVEVNRYSRTQIVIIDEALGERRLSAVLKAGDVETLLDGISRLDMARIVRVDPDRVELRIRHGQIAERHEPGRAVT